MSDRETGRTIKFWNLKQITSSKVINFFQETLYEIITTHRQLGADNLGYCQSFVFIMFWKPFLVIEFFETLLYFF